MTLFQDIKAYAENKDTEDLLRCILKEKFPGRTTVTASLKARSVAVLKIVSEIDPTTPIVFCHARELFEESRAYRDRVVALLGLTNVRESRGEPAGAKPGDADHFECMWVEDSEGGGLVHECVHLNDVLAGCDCWISAVYSAPEKEQPRDRVDVSGRLIRVDPLRDWSDADVRAFLQDSDIPLHPRAAKDSQQKGRRKPAGDVVYYSY